MVFRKCISVEGKLLTLKYVLGEETLRRKDKHLSDGVEIGVDTSGKGDEFCEIIVKKLDKFLPKRKGLYYRASYT
jgi:hypothetical protein